MTCIGKLVLYSYSFCPSPGHVCCEVRWKYFHNADCKSLTHLKDVEPTGVGFLFLTLYCVTVANTAASSALQLGNLRQPGILPVDTTNSGQTNPGSKVLCCIMYELCMICSPKYIPSCVLVG